MTETTPKTLLSNYILSAQLRSILSMKNIQTIYPKEENMSKNIESIYYDYQTEMKSRITNIQSNIESSIPSEHWDLLAIDHKGNKKSGEEIEKSIKQLKKIKNWLDENITLKKETLIKLMAEIQRTADDSPLHTIIKSKRPISTQDLMTKIVPN